MNLAELGKGKEKLNIIQSRGILVKAFEKAIWRIGRWASEADRKAGKIYSKKEALRLFGAPQFTTIKGNCLLNEGINYLTTMIGTDAKTGTPWSNANARLGVGDSSTAADATQTGLQAATNKFWKAMMATFPTYGTSQKITWKSSFGSAEANYAWNEFTVVNAADDTGQNLCRKVSAEGTKTSGQTWELTLEITLS